MKHILTIILLSFLISQDCDEGYSYIPVEDIPFSATSLPFNLGQAYTCFNDGDLAFLNDLNGMNNLGYDSALHLGTQTWNSGKLKIFVGTYTPNGAGINTTQINTVPETISNLNELTTLYLEWNHITSLPSTFTSLPSLKNLYISNNQLQVLPDDFGNLQELKILDLGYNYIPSIPESFVDLINLEYLWLFNNDITSIPAGICDLNIAWSEMDNSYYPYFAIGGNELCYSDQTPECILNSDHFDESLDQFYYSFMYVVDQDCADINDDNAIDILDVLLIVEAIMDYDLPSQNNESYNHMDVNDDSEIDIIDLIALISIILSN